MKAWLSALLAGGLCASAAWWHTNREAARRLAVETARHAALAADWERERTRLEAELASVRGNATKDTPLGAVAPAVVVTFPPPASTLEKLRQLRPDAGGNRTALRRQVIHQLGHLADAGPSSIPVIREFLSRMEDVEYGAEGEGEAARDRSGASLMRGRPRASLAFEFPPSLRLGLVDVLVEIGGLEAESVLAGMLEITARGVEVAYVAKALQSMAPGQYRDPAIAAATELLTHPPVIESPTRLDANAKDYLYQVLQMFNDTSFAGAAQQMLVSADGRVDREVLGYLNGSLKELAMPAIYQAYQDPRLSNQWEKAALVGASFNYIGPNSQANQMFQDVLAATNVPTPLKAMAVASLVGTDRGVIIVERPTDPGMIEARIGFLQGLQAGTEDAQLRAAMERTIENLNRIRDGREPRNPGLDLRDIFRGSLGGGTRAGGGN